MDTVLNATVGQEVTLTVTTFDKDGDVVTLELISALPSGASFDTASGVITWTPANKDVVSLG